MKKWKFRPFCRCRPGRILEGVHTFVVRNIQRRSLPRSARTARSGAKKIAVICQGSLHSPTLCPTPQGPRSTLLTPSLLIIYKETSPKKTRGPARDGHAPRGRLLCPVRLFAWKRREMRPVLCGSSLPSSIGVRETAHARSGAILETRVRLVLRCERVRVGEGRRARRLFGQGTTLIARASDDVVSILMIYTILYHCRIRIGMFTSFVPLWVKCL